MDEIAVDPQTVKDIPMSSVAYIKAFKPPFLGSMLNGFSGVIVIYTKKGFSPVEDAKSTAGLERIVLKGYTRFKEFVNDQNPGLQDKGNIPTVYWNPFILTDKNSQTIELEFNNGGARKLVALLEGIDATGRLTRSVTILE